MVRTRSQLVQASHQAQPAQNNAPPSFNSEHATSALSTSSAPHRIPELCPRSTEGSSPRTEGQPTISEGTEEESEDFLDDGKEMLKWGYILLVGSTTCFAVGIWSIAIGPYVDASGLDVSAPISYCPRRISFQMPALCLLDLRNARKGYILQVPRVPTHSCHDLLRHHQLVGIKGEYFFRKVSWRALRDL